MEVLASHLFIADQINSSQDSLASSVAAQGLTRKFMVIFFECMEQNPIVNGLPAVLLLSLSSLSWENYTENFQNFQS